MRMPLGRRLRGSQARSSSFLGVESLEPRLTLSHAPLDAPHAPPDWNLSSQLSFDRAGGYPAQSGNTQPPVYSIGLSDRGADFHPDIFHPDLGGRDFGPSREIVSVSPIDATPAYVTQNLAPVYTEVIIVITFYPQPMTLDAPPPSSTATAPRPKGPPPSTQLAGDGESIVSGVSQTHIAVTSNAAAHAIQSANEAAIANGLAAISNSVKPPAPVVLPLIMPGGPGPMAAPSDAPAVALVDPESIPHVDSEARPVEPGVGDIEVQPLAPQHSWQLVGPRMGAAIDAVVGWASGSHAVKVSLAAAGLSRGALMATIPIDSEAVDEALQAVMSEMELFGGELADWLEDFGLPPWAAAATAVSVAGVGAHYYAKRRRGRGAEAIVEEESSSWLFSRLHTPAG